MRRIAILTTLGLVLAGLTALAGPAAPAQAAGQTLPVHVGGPAVTVVGPSTVDTRSVVFAGLAGQTVTVSATGTFTANCDLKLRLVDPTTGSTLAGPACTGVSGALPATALTRPALYRVVWEVTRTGGNLDVQVTGTGRSSITPGAGQLSVDVPAGGTVRLGFLVRAGTFASVQLVGGQLFACTVSLQIVDRTGATLLPADCPPIPVTYRVEAPTDGVDTVVLRNTGSTAAQVRLRPEIGTDLVGTLTSGVPTALDFTVHGQLARLTVPGLAGRKLSVSATGWTFSTLTRMRVLDPAGTEVLVHDFTSVDETVPVPLLTSSGAYTLVLGPSETFGDPNAVQLGTVTLAATVATPPSVPLAVPTTVTLPGAGRPAAVTFTGTPGRRPVLTFTRQTWRTTPPGGFAPTPSPLLFRPDGTFYGPLSAISFTDPNLYATTADAPAQGRLDQAGTWTLVLDPQRQVSGSGAFRLAQQADLERTVAVGTPVTLTLRPAQQARLGFDAVAGQRPWLRIDPPAGPLQVRLYRPDGSLRGSTFVAPGTEQGFLETFPDGDSTQTGGLGLTADVPGRWTAVLTEVGAPTVTVSVGAATDPAPARLRTAVPNTVRVAEPGQAVPRRFRTTAAGRLDLHLVGADLPGVPPADRSATFLLLGPDGTLAGATTLGTGFPDGSLTVPSAGAWTLVTDLFGDRVGTVTFRAAAA